MRLARLAALLMLVAACAAAQTAPQPPLRGVAVTAQGQVQAQPDTAVLAFNVAAQAQTAANAYAEAQRQTETIRGLLRRNGIATSEAQLGAYQLQPQYDWKTRQVTGYAVTVNVSVELEDFGKIAPILDQAGAAGLPASQSVEFRLKNEQAAKDRAVAAAFRNARQEAEALAEAAGVSLGALRSAAIDVQEPPRPILRFPGTMVAAEATAMRAPTEAFAPHLITVTATVHAAFDLRPAAPR